MEEEGGETIVEEEERVMIEVKTIEVLQILVEEEKIQIIVN
jgi:hypothetical protein